MIAVTTDCVILTVMTDYGGRSANTLSASKFENAEAQQQHSSFTICGYT